jgi:hypothetical protein
VSRKKLSKAMKRRKLNRKAKPEEFFWTCDGKVIKSVKELAEALDSMEDQVYYNHVTSERNDFSNWVRSIFNEKTLAKNLTQTNNRLEAQLVTLKHLIKNL